MSDVPALHTLFAARYGLSVTSVEPTGDTAYNVRIERVINGDAVGRAAVTFHTGPGPWDIGAVLSQRIQAASGADPKFTPYILADFSACPYSDGSVGALRRLRDLLDSGSLYGSCMGTYLDAAARGGKALAEEMSMRSGERSPSSGGGKPQELATLEWLRRRL